MGSLMKVLPDEARITFTIKQLRMFMERAGGEEGTVPFKPVGTKRASEITGMEARELRRRHELWHRIQQDGGRPQVRVSRKTANPRSDLLFDENDCWKLRSDNGGGPRPVDDEAPKKQSSTDSRTPPANEDYSGDPDDLEAITDRLADAVRR